MPFLIVSCVLAERVKESSNFIRVASEAKDLQRYLKARQRRKGVLDLFASVYWEHVVLFFFV